jgi:osmoprotectant transport system substrate-binding protein
VLGAYPAIGPALDPIFASLTLETLQQLNARIAVGGEQPEAVAVSYLKSKHFLP